MLARADLDPRRGPDLARPASFAVDLTAGVAPLLWRCDANPDGLAPEVVAGLDGPALRLAVRTGAYPDAVAGEPERCQRGELREPDPLGREVRSVHAFDLRLAPGFPRTRLRCVVAQLKGNDGLSPVFALRVHMGRLYADWRVGAARVEHHAPICGPAETWRSFRLAVRPEGASLHVDGALVTRIRCPLPERRYLKLGPYRDRDPAWGEGAAAVEVRAVSRTILEDLP